MRATGGDEYHHAIGMIGVLIGRPSIRSKDVDSRNLRGWVGAVQLCQSPVDAVEPIPGIIAPKPNVAINDGLPILGFIVLPDHGEIAVEQPSIIQGVQIAIALLGPIVQEEGARGQILVGDSILLIEAFDQKEHRPIGRAVAKEGGSIRAAAGKVGLLEGPQDFQQLLRRQGIAAVFLLWQINSQTIQPILADEGAGHIGGAAQGGNRVLPPVDFSIRQHRGMTSFQIGAVFLQLVGNVGNQSIAAQRQPEIILIGEHDVRRFVLTCQQIDLRHVIRALHTHKLQIYIQFAKHPALNIAYPGVVLAGAIFLGHVLPVIDHDAKRFRLCRRAPMHKERQRQQEKEKREQAHLSHRKYLNHFL